MAANTAQSLLLQTFGQKGVEAHNQAKKAVPKPDMGGDLPGGVRGVARLTHLQIKPIEKGKKDEGKLMFFGRGIVVKPDTHDGIPISGCATSVMEAIFDTPTRTRKTWQEHLEWIYSNILKRVFNVKVEQLGMGDIEPCMKALVDKGALFVFRTFKPPKQTTGQYKDVEPMVQHIWVGPAPSNAVEKVTTDTYDKDVGDTTSTDSELDNLDNPDLNAEYGKPTQEEDTTTTESNDDDNTHSLIEDGDTEPEEQTDDEEQVDEDATESEVGKVYKYKPYNKVTKAYGKAVEVEITEVQDDGTYVIKEVANPVKKYRGVKKERLETM